MLAWVVIDRQQPRQAAPLASLHFTPLFPLPHLSPLLPTPTDTPTQRTLLNPFAINPLRTLLISTGGVYPLPPFPYTQSPSCPEQSRGIPFLFTFLRTLLRFF